MSGVDCHPQCSLDGADHPGSCGYRCIDDGGQTLPFPGECLALGLCGLPAGHDGPHYEYGEAGSFLPRGVDFQHSTDAERGPNGPERA